MGAARMVGGLLALAVIAVGGWIAFTAGASGSPSVPDPRAAPPALAAASPAVVVAGAASDAQQLYLQACATCHGTAGEGTQFGPSLADAGPAAFDFYLRTGRMPLSAPGQPAFRQGRPLSDEEIRALVGYGATLGQGPPIPTIATTASIADGWQLFINNCAACHGATGSGGSVGPGVFAPSLHGKDAQTIAEAVVIGPGQMPRFDWDSQQLADVAAYVEGLGSPPSPGGQSLGGFGPVPEGLLAGVLGLGLIVLVCRWIGRGTREERAGETEGSPVLPDDPASEGPS